MTGRAAPHPNPGRDVAQGAITHTTSTAAITAITEKLGWQNSQPPADDDR